MQVLIISKVNDTEVYAIPFKDFYSNDGDLVIKDIEDDLFIFDLTLFDFVVFEHGVVL